MNNKKRFNKIYIEITNICNLKCSFCPDTIREKKYMKFSDFKEILNRAKDFAGIITLHVKGEPLIHPELDKILEYCSQNDVKVNITTNGTKLLENKEILTQKCIRQINVSLHSINKNEGINEEEYLENIYSSIDYISKNNSKIFISYRLWNLKDIKQNDSNYNILNFLGAKYKIEDLIDKMKVNMFIELKKNVFINQDVEFEWPDLNREIIEEKGSCLGIRKQIAILVNGDVVPCCMDQNGDIILGNILNESLDEILDKDLTKKIIKGFEENKLICDLCKKCGYRTKFN